MATYAAQASNGAGITSNQYGQYSEASNSHGTIKANGTVTSNVVGSVTTPRPVVATFASTPIDSATTVADYATIAISSGVFAHNHVEPISSLVTTELAGLSNSAILSPGNDNDNIRSINSLVTLRTRRFTTAIRTNKYNRFDNTFESGYPVVAVDSLASDNAATPTQSVPGELTYMTGAKTPVNDEYKAKTNF